MQKKIITYIIIFFIIICSATYTYADVDNSLDNFIKTYSVENMSSNDIIQKLSGLKFSNDDQKRNCVNKVSEILSQVEELKKDEDKIKRLNEEFKTQCTYVLDTTDPFYLYYGYALGQKRVQIKKTQESVGDTSGKTAEELQKQFNTELSKYQRSKKKDEYETAKEYYDKLNAINEQIKDKDKKQYKENLSALDSVYTVVVNGEPTKDKVDNNNGGEDKKEGTDAVLGESSASPNHTLDEIIKEGNSFLSQAEKGDKINELNLKSASDTLYNILLVIGIATAVIIGMYLGAKFMLSSAEDKAKVKEALIPYIAGCVVIFGAFVIWKLVIVLLGGIA